ncbi:hypothetical protein CXG81DRAFT_29062 [Caulochytrium protostelioides]|uniref:Ribosomal protein L13 n=1 Tax=Caulochytrium protostelioides TaxID=1555241 RepID=A0A4P9XFH7_9FUNG|nr:hypothetical protein CXG81DRAFT_29062 [Caulochytrium protostelioides]|eukprot:RKP04353.1 hypothetical protein CXG81DRAFT_29062 [Caulochytrium protostelioides]
MAYEKEIVIDGKDHLMGRLGSIVAKQLLNGHKVTVVRCESLVMTGHFYRTKLKYQAFLRKRCLVNPRKGPYHFRAPSRMFARLVRGMVPHKTARGSSALNRLHCYEGVPPAYNKVARQVVPDALRALRLPPNRKVTVISRLATEMGWKYAGVVEKLEAKRKAEGKAYFEAKKQLLAKRAAAVKTAKAALKPAQAQILAANGF